MRASVLLTAVLAAGCWLDRAGLGTGGAGASATSGSGGMATGGATGVPSGGMTASGGGEGGTPQAGGAGEGGAPGGAGHGGSGGGLCTPGSKAPCYTGPMGTDGVGPCLAGEVTCDPSGMAYGPCEGEVLPGVEVCGNLVDEDCDGKVPAGTACLSDTNLLVRYFIDEADGGMAPTELVDSAPQPLNLKLTYASGEPVFAAEPTGRALDWKIAGGDGRASVAIDGTKVHAGLDGMKRLTYEVVLHATAVMSAGTRFLHIGDGAEWRLSLGSTGIASIRFSWRNSVMVGEWGVSVSGRKVVHLVLDTTLGNAADRVRLYADGVPATKTGGTPPAKDASIALLTKRYLVIGNREVGQRSPSGRIYYAAVYSHAMSAGEVADHAAILAAGDDSPP